LDVRLTTLLCKIITVAKSKEVKTDAIWQNLLKNAIDQKGCFSNYDDEMWVGTLQMNGQLRNMPMWGNHGDEDVVQNEQLFQLSSLPLQELELHIKYTSRRVFLR
jgi:hypothetical protein